MMDRLEKFIIENRDDFNMYEPNPDVWNKIQKSMVKGKVKKLNWRTVIWRAAIIIVIFGSAFTLFELIHNGESLIGKKRIERKIDKIPELAEAEIYYSSLVNSKLEEVNTYLKSNPEIQKGVLQDLSELDKMYDELKNDLYDNIATQEIVEAMIQNYRLKLEILENILNELSEKDKTNKNEKIEYEL